MNREFLTKLISKDLEELRILIDGFIEQPEQPRKIVELASKKASMIADNLMQLLDKEETTTNDNENKIYFKPEDTMPFEQTATNVESDNNETTVETVDDSDIAENNQEEINDTLEETDYEKIDDNEETIVNEEIDNNETTTNNEDVIDNNDVPEVETITNDETTFQDSNNETQTPIKNEGTTVELDLFSSVGLEVTPTPNEDNTTHKHSIFDTIKNDHTIASALQHKRIDNLMQSLTVSDRFLYQRELFGGNGETFMKTIETFNNMNSLDEVEKYVHSNYPNWLENNKFATDFLSIVARKFY